MNKKFCSSRETYLQPRSRQPWNDNKLDAAAKKIFFIIAFSAIFLLVPKSSFASEQVVINEIFTDPTGTDTGLEWIELYNPTFQPVNLTGWQLNAASGKYYTFPSFNLLSQTFVIIHWRADGQNNTEELFTGTQTIDENMGNKSGFVALFRSSEHNKDTISDYLEYGEAGKTWESTAVSAGIWTTGQFIKAAGEGQSFGLKQDGQDQNMASDWQVFNQPTPNQTNGSSLGQSLSQTPEQQTPAETQEEAAPQSATSTEPTYQQYSDKVLINEFLPWPDSDKEWVELINSDTKIIDLSDWQIDDESEGSPAQRIPTGTLIEPNQILVIELNKNIFNNDGDQGRLLWPDGQVVHSVSYQKALTGQSAARFGEGFWFWTNQPTPGEENKKSIARSTASVSQKGLPQQSSPPPLIAAISESVSETKPEIEQRTTFTVKMAENSSSLSSPQTQSSAPPKTSIPTKAAVQKTTPGSNSKTFLLLTSVVALSLLSGLSLIYFKRKTMTRIVDPEKKSKNVPF